MEKISIIIPCYNVEKYIDRCVSSIVKQTIGLDKLEIILVNDASTDHTLDKLKEWESLYPQNIIVISYGENLRQGGARNVGLQYASGKYIGFLDSDDWIEEGMYMELYKHMISGKYDVVKCKFVRDTGEHPVAFNENAIVEGYENIFEPVSNYYWAEPTKKGVLGEYGSINTGLYFKDFLTEHELVFPEHMAYEDNYWTNMLRLYVSSIYVIDYPYYHYCTNMSSTTTTRNAKHQLDRIKIEEMWVARYAEIGALDIYYDKIVSDFIERYYLNTLFIVFTRFDYIPDIYNRMRQFIDELFPDWYKHYNFEHEIEPHLILLLWLLEHSKATNDEMLQLKLDYLVSLNSFIEGKA